MKTNKSYKKRLKVTKKGKVLARKTGQDHFNAKESGDTKIKKKKPQKIHITKKTKDRFLTGV